MRKVLIALAAFAAVAVGAAIPAGAGEGTYMVSFDPEEGPPETVVTFTSETACPSQNTGVVSNAPGDTFGAISLDPEPSDASDFLVDVPVDGEGQWELQYTIPEDAPPGEITFYSYCVVEDFPPDIVEAAAIPDDFYISAAYDESVFTVTEAPPVTSTTTSTTAPTTTTTRVAPKLVASPTTVAPGGTIAVTASGFAPGSNVVITLESDPVNLGTFVADNLGNIAANVVVPADFPVGGHTLKLTGTDIAGAVLVLSTGITVASAIQVTTTVAAAVTTSSTLPQTGTSFTTPALVVGGGLVLVGAVAVVAARRRRALAQR